MRSVGYAASLREGVGWVTKPRADDPHPDPPPFRGRERTEIVARLLNHLAGVAQPVKITVPRYSMVDPRLENDTHRGILLA